MEIRAESKEVKWLDRWYRFTRHFGSELLEIEMQERYGLFKDKYRYVRLYLGHPHPLEVALSLFAEKTVPTSKEKEG